MCISDVCEKTQCNYGSSCKLVKTRSDALLSSCTCEANGDHTKLPVTHACKRADNGRIYLNTAHIHNTECSMKHYFTFKDLCRGIMLYQHGVLHAFGVLIASP